LKVIDLSGHLQFALPHRFARHSDLECPANRANIVIGFIAHKSFLLLFGLRA
jgi:hypothetical protein